VCGQGQIGAIKSGHRQKRQKNLEQLTMTLFKLAQSIRQTSSHCISGPICMAALLAMMPLAAQAVPLSFDQMIGTPTGSNVLGPTAGESTIYFRDVATDNGLTVDARITTVLVGDTDFADQNDPNAENYFGDSGYIPDYNNSPGGPEKDLGFLYYGNGVNGEENGLNLTLEFFDGTGDRTGSFLDPIAVSSLEIAIYDVDGEASQSEYFSVNRNDGLVAYATGTSTQSLTAAEIEDTVRFDGPGTNYSESDATGAAILYYELTDMVNINFGSVQSSGPNQNAVFSAIDGDLTLFLGGGFGDPTDVTVVPLPASRLLFLVGLAGSLAFFRRGSA
jgi:hypothetical protein